MIEKEKESLEPREIYDNQGNKYYKQRFLGKGKFGKCYECKSEDNDLIYAIKVLNKATFNENSNNEIGQKIKEMIKEEIKIQQSFNCSKIVKIKAYFEDDNNVYIVLENCKNKSLSDLLERRKHLTEIEVQCYIFQLIEGLKIIHKNNYIHRDLKPQNLFLDDKLELKIGDFGLATIINENEKKKDIVGTPIFVAPEIVNENNIGYSFEVDIWAIGIIMYNLLTGDYPFKGDEKKLYEKILKSDFDFPENIKISEAAKDLIKQILVKDPRKRPSLVQILYHDFFHIYKFPKFFNPSTLIAPPDIKEYNPDINEDEIIKKEVKLKNLYKAIIPDIFEIRYEDINKYIVKAQSQFEFESFENWISYFHISKTNNFYYYEVNNGTIGIIYENRESILYDKKNKAVYYITPKNNGENEIKNYDKEKCPNELKEKFEELINYYEKKEFKKGKKIKILIDGKYAQNSNKEKDGNKNEIENGKNIYKEKEINYKTNKNQKKLFYIKRLEDEKKAYFLYFPCDIEQIIFKDKVEIIISYKRNNILFVDKDKNRIIVPIPNLLKITNKDLISKLKYIRNHSVTFMQQKFLEKKGMKNSNTNKEI